MPGDVGGTEGGLWEGRGTGRRPGTRRVTQREAADALGISVEAIKKRVKRGSLPSEMGEDGRRYVYLDAIPGRVLHERRPRRQTPEAHRPPRRRAERGAAGPHQSLERQLEQANERDRENRRIIAALTSRIPAIEAPEAPDSPVPADTPNAATAEAQEGGEPRSWWRRMFGV